MVGLGWYLDVFGSDSHVLVLIFGEFWRKSENEQGGKKLGKNRAFIAAKGTFVVVKSFAMAMSFAVEKSFAVAK